MKKTNNKQIKIFYAIATLALIISIISMTGILSNNNENKDEWRCNYIDCAEIIELSGEEWARENCQITTQGTICTVITETGERFEAPLEELNLEEITATKCIKYVCLEEIPYREVNYDINLEDYNN